ncbi:MAG: ABC transporter permease, partial [Frankia sp.]|nr:ABC transporter permease [Frankia sp.]
PPPPAAAAGAGGGSLAGVGVTAWGLVRRLLAPSGGLPGWLPPLGVLAVLVAVVQVLGPGFLTTESVGIKIASAMTLILVACGETLVVLRGGIDLSVGGTFSLASAIAATRADAGFGALLPWLVVILAVGALVGVVNGLLVTALDIQPFLVTLATWSIAEGIALTILPAEGGATPLVWFELGNESIGEVPAGVVLFAALVAWWLWFRRTRLARAIVATGSSERGAYLNRVSIARTNVVAYALAGLFAAMGGLYYATQIGAGSPTAGTEYVLPAIAAVVVGGTSLAGGRGGLGGTIIGALVLYLVGDVVFLLELRSYWQPLVSGVILVAVVAASHLLAGRDDALGGRA